MRKHFLRDVASAFIRVALFPQLDEVGIFRKTARIEVQRDAFFRHTCFTALILAMDTGWPPPELFVIVNITSGIFSAPPARSVRPARHVHVSFEWMQVAGLLGFRDRNVHGGGAHKFTLARVVSKCVLFGTMSPFLHITLNRMRSAARPWCVGITWRNPKIVCTDSRNR